MSDSADADLIEQILDAFNLSPEERAWAMTPDPAEEYWRERERRYVESLPCRRRRALAEVNAHYADVLPEGMRFELT